MESDDDAQHEEDKPDSLLFREIHSIEFLMQRNHEKTIIVSIIFIRRKQHKIF